MREIRCFEFCCFQLSRAASSIERNRPACANTPICIGLDKEYNEPVNKLEVCAQDPQTQKKGASPRAACSQMAMRLFHYGLENTGNGLLKQSESNDSLPLYQTPLV